MNFLLNYDYQDLCRKCRKTNLVIGPLLFLSMILTGCDSTEKPTDEEAVAEKVVVAEKAPVSATEQVPDATPVQAGLATPGLDPFTSVDKSNPNWRQQLSLPEMMKFEENQAIYWQLDTNVGKMRFRLFHKTAPMHVTSTIYLTELGFYDSLIFHRVIPGFMAQGGDPTGTGRGSPGYQYDGEFQGGLSHNKPGMLSMANAGPGTDGSQFFITFVPTPFLDAKHTLFGELVEGQDTLDALAERGSRSGKTSEKLQIVSASISRM